jgi:DNA-binding transcriptional MerR regulator
MATQLSHRRASETPTIPDRLYFKIGDVARICGLETYVLRFWESQFPQLKPNKSGTGQRLYRRREVELVLEIKRLVHEEGYTLPGARHALDQHKGRFGEQESNGHKDTKGSAETRNGQNSLQEMQPASPSGALHSSVPGNGHRNDTTAAVIGHARAELREIAAMLAEPAPRPMRRRTRLTAVLDSSESLFPC